MCAMKTRLPLLWIKGDWRWCFRRTNHCRRRQVWTRVYGFNHRSRRSYSLEVSTMSPNLLTRHCTVAHFCVMCKILGRSVAGLRSPELRCIGCRIVSLKFVSQGHSRYNLKFPAGHNAATSHHQIICHHQTLPQALLCLRGY